MPFTGQETEFKRELSTQITEVLLNDMMYGGSLKEVLQSSYLLQLPDWFIAGASAYAAEGWSVEMDGFMRDMTKQYPTGTARRRSFCATPQLAGQSIWNYVAERYGYTTIQNILNLTRITRDVEVGISSSLNVPFQSFLKDWLTYYRELNGQPVATLVDARREIPAERPQPPRRRILAARAQPQRHSGWLTCPERPGPLPRDGDGTATARTATSSAAAATKRPTSK